jgi:MATE family multidrug resistance protein
MFPAIRRELSPMLRIAVPVVLAELGWMAMGVVDTIMVGPLGPQAISAAGVGNSMHIAFAIFGMAIMLGLDALVSQAYGARDLRECHRLFYDGVALAAVMALPLMAVLAAVWLAIPFLGFHGEVLPLLQSYFGVAILSTPSLLVYATCRRYLTGMHTAVPVMVALVTANAINAAGNWILIYGNLGLPALGVAGSAWATFVSRLYMVAVLLIGVWWYDKKRTREAGIREASLWLVDWRFDWPRLRRLWRLGFPAASQMGAEVGVFALATAMSGMLDPISSAAHQISLNLAGLAFMIPLGVGAAGAVRVGYWVGACEPVRVAASGWTAILIGTGFMVASGVLFVVMPERLIALFSADAGVLRVGTALLLLAALFQLFDGIQGVITGTLRGLGDTRTPMIANLGAHWLLGLPTSYTLCFLLGWGVYGLWVGLTLGLIVVAVILLWVWTRRISAVRLQIADRLRR